MAKRALVGGVSAKLTQFSWWGGGEWPDHMGSLEVDEPESRRNIYFRTQPWKTVLELQVGKTVKKAWNTGSCQEDTHFKNGEKK